MFDAGFACARSCSIFRAHALYTRTASHKNLNIPLVKEVCLQDVPDSNEVRPQRDLGIEPYRAI